MLSSSCFRINDKSVVHEAVDGEVLAINLETGTYYSLSGAGAHIWSCLAGRASVESIAQVLAGIYDGDRGTMTAAVSELIVRMKKENLIVPDAGLGAEPAHEIPSPGSGKTAFVPPILEVYSDMQDLLLLDPIHEVDDRGWPSANLSAARQAKT